MAATRRDWKNFAPAIGAFGLAAIGLVVAIALNAKDRRDSTVGAGFESAPEIVRTNWPVHIREPDGPPCVPTGLTDFAGKAVTVSCSTCHATTSPNRDTRSSEQLTSFHQGLHYQHGGLSCLSCHNPGDYDTLRLADGTSIEFRNVMQLCSQCHGTQARDYAQGAHGGMTGYWDLARGPRHRNNCIDCHDAHAPKYQPVMPVFPPLEQLLEQQNPAKRKAH